jgi:methyltransferase family protein
MPERARLALRRLGRLRWLTKARNLRRTGAGPWSGRPVRIARFVLLDPEVDTYSYWIDNAGELADCLAPVLDRPPEEVRALLREALEDIELGERLTRDIGWRVLFHKRRPPLAGHHLSAYAIVRALGPEVAVETGILDGLGSRTMLRALQRNADEGRLGHLWSFDIMPGAGALVPERLAPRWTPLYEPTERGLPRLLDGHSVDFFIHDSLPDPEHQRRELVTALDSARPGAVVMTAYGWTGVLKELATERGLTYAEFRERPRDHFYGGRHLAWARAWRRP